MTLTITKLLASLALVAFVMLLPGSSESQTQLSPTVFTLNQELYCNSNIPELLNGLRRNHGEVLVFASEYSEDEHTQISMFHNKRTKSYTIVQFMTVIKQSTGEKNFAACILASGKTDLDWKVLAEFFA